MHQHHVRNAKLATTTRVRTMSLYAQLVARASQTAKSISNPTNMQKLGAMWIVGTVGATWLTFRIGRGRGVRYVDHDARNNRNASL